ncbi:MAG TPA: NUDIX hydrolase, partial [Dongiaceae bacterium]|nr:NUDIX hydrolase [Dongiaceae bacterium]
FRAKLSSEKIEPGPESLDVGLFRFDDIPWDDLAFPSVRWALHHYVKTRSLHDFTAFTNPEGETGDF